MNEASIMTPSTVLDELLMPEYVRARLGDRENYIYRHGFAESEIKPQWWNDRLDGLGHVSVDPNGTRALKLTRGDLFTVAGTLETAPRDESGVWVNAYLNLLWHVLAWGSGVSRRNNDRRIKAFVDIEDRRRKVRLLRESATHARSGNVSAAYTHLLRQIDGLGPAFFTKFLYFVGRGEAGHPCLILDARVAESLYDAGWTTLPRTRIKGRWSYSYQWHPNTYASYCDLLTRWAKDASTVDRPVAPDEIERALFEGRLDAGKRAVRCLKVRRGVVG